MPNCNTEDSLIIIIIGGLLTLLNSYENAYEYAYKQI